MIRYLYWYWGRWVALLTKHINTIFKMMSRDCQYRVTTSFKLFHWVSNYTNMCFQYQLTCKFLAVFSQKPLQWRQGKWFLLFKVLPFLSYYYFSYNSIFYPLSFVQLSSNDRQNRLKECTISQCQHQSSTNTLNLLQITHQHFLSSNIIYPQIQRSSVS